MSILAKIKASPVKWTLGIGAGVLAVDYLLEGHASFASSIYRGIFGSNGEHDHLHARRGGHAAHAAVAQPGLAQPGLAQPGLAQPGMMQGMPGMDPSMYAGPVFYPTLPAGYGPYRGGPYRGERRLPGHMYGHGEFGHGHFSSHDVHASHSSAPGHPVAHAIVHGR